ncbi:MAG: DUF1566 domain-containing protein [Chromatiaceae bacterium]|nr:DUF1566 domain-containing protein [Chromatiaceae bacterium]
MKLSDNNAGSSTITAGATSFTLPNALNAGSNYAVSVQTQPTGQTCTVSNGSGTNIAANVTTVSVTCISTYTVTYNGNVNTGGTVPTDGNSPYTSGATVTVLGNTGSLTKTGYTFNGWNTAANATGTSYAPAATFTINAALTLYAKWTANTHAAGPTGLLNDTGQIHCLNVAGTPWEACSETNTGKTSPRPGQDGRFGRDPAAGNPVLSGFSKPAGSGGNGGFAFTPLDVSGNAIALTGTPPVPSATPRCIKDNVTNLIWEVKTNDSGLQDMDWGYLWGSNAAVAGQCGSTLTVAGACNNVNYINAVNALNLCGETADDWRLPSRRELLSILDHDRYNPAIDPAYFLNTPNKYYWSADLWANNTLYAWTVYFSDGNTVATDRATYYGSIRLVRSGQ